MRLLPLTIALLAFATTGCKTPDRDAAHTRSAALRGPERPAAFAHLAALSEKPPRTGILVVDDDTLHLRLRKGEASRPFMSIARGSLDRGCWQNQPPHQADGYEEFEESSWWVFHDAKDAVAVEFAAWETRVFFWDEERQCAVGTRAFANLFDGAVPEGYFEGEDVQTAYYWVYTSEQVMSRELVVQIDGDAQADILRDVEGIEQFVLEPNLVSVLASDGRSLLREEFEGSPNQLCYNTQIMVFERPGGGVYVSSTFEATGNDTSCWEPQAQRYGHTISEWDANQGRFVRRFSTYDEILFEGIGSDRARGIVRRRLAVEGGALVVETENRSRREEKTEPTCTEREAATGVCLVEESCYRTSALEDRTTTWRFEGEDGLDLRVGRGRQGYTEEIADCPTP